MCRILLNAYGLQIGSQCLNDEKKLRIWIKRDVMGFHDKHSSQNHYIWFFLIVHMQLYKLWKPEFVSFDFNLIKIWPNSINVNDSFSWDLNKNYHICIIIHHLFTQIRFSAFIGDIFVWHMTRNQTMINKICAIISKTHDTMLWDTGLAGIFICLKPSISFNCVLGYVIVVLFYSRQYT